MNTTADLPDALPGNGVCEATPAGGDCTLRSAILRTNVLAGADTIDIPGGTFALTSALIDPNTLTLRRVHLLDNGAKQGGAILAATEAVIFIEDSLIQGNVTIANSPP